MKVLKFGGTSVGSPVRMNEVAKLVTIEDQSKIVVLSAVSGTTNALVAIGEKLISEKVTIAVQNIALLREKYDQFVIDLLPEEEQQAKGKNIVSEVFSLISSLTEDQFGEKESKILLAQGELLSTQLFHQFLLMKKYNAVLIPALDFMSIDKNDEPEVEAITPKIKPLIQGGADGTIFITQGYICLNDHCEIDNLKRGGSDYTASLIGAAIASEEVQIWTDIDGMHNNDPRIVDKTVPIEQLSFDEAAELAYFGAKILHPSTILPAQKYHIPVRLKNTLDPAAGGTIINDVERSESIKAVAAKDGITAIKIKSTRMLLAHGFLRRVFELFEKHNTSIDMITTSEIAVSLTIDDEKYLDKIVKELESFCTVEIDTNQSIICIVGNMIMYKKGIIKRVFDALEDIPLRMISFGGSKNNVSVLVDSEHKNRALQQINEGVFGLVKV